VKKNIIPGSINISTLKTTIYLHFCRSVICPKRNLIQYNSHLFISVFYYYYCRWDSRNIIDWLLYRLSVLIDVIYNNYTHMAAATLLLSCDHYNEQMLLPLEVCYENWESRLAKDLSLSVLSLTSFLTMLHILVLGFLLKRRFTCSFSVILGWWALFWQFSQKLIVPISFHRKVGISLIDVTGNNIFNSYLYSGRASQSWFFIQVLDSLWYVSRWKCNKQSYWAPYRVGWYTR
jgi:hypothetical protein